MLIAVFIIVLVSSFLGLVLVTCIYRELNGNGSGRNCFSYTCGSVCGIPIRNPDCKSLSRGLATILIKGGNLHTGCKVGVVGNDLVTVGNCNVTGVIDFYIDINLVTGGDSADFYLTPYNLGSTAVKEGVCLLFVDVECAVLITEQLLIAGVSTFDCFS